MKNKLFVLIIMMLFPISLIGTLLFVEPESFKEYLLSAVLSYLLWFVLHSLILAGCMLIFKRND